jgi:hypothetical protein
MVIRATMAHLFHIGDARIGRITEKGLEQLTEEHRVVISSVQSYLGRALGMKQQVEIDYRAVPLQKGDIFLLATDGAYEHASPQFVAEAVKRLSHDLDAAARAIGEEAYRHGSDDNITVQIVRIDELPEGQARDVVSQATNDLPLPPLLDARMEFDGYRVVREIHASSRSHIYLAVDSEGGDTVALKTPSIDLAGDPDYLRRFRMEEWVARRIDSAHVLKPRIQTRRRNYLYVTSEFVEGQTLTQWMIDNPSPPLETVRDIVEQIARGLQAFHRLEMIHQDLRPENIMIDRTGTVKIIDFGATSIAGITDDATLEILGTAQYTAPEYFLGEGGTSRSDIFSLGVIAYQMLTGQLPYGAAVAKTRTKAQQRRLKYKSALDDDRDIPSWVDGALRKAVEPGPNKRYAELSEFVFDLRNPNASLEASPPALIERNPLLFWQCLTAALVIVILILLAMR